MISYNQLLMWFLGIVSSILCAILIKLYNDLCNFKKREKENKQQKIQSNNDMILGITRLHLKETMEKAITRGYTTSSEYEVVNKLFKAYVSNGGNGTIKHIFEDEYDELKIKDQGEKNG